MELNCGIGLTYFNLPSSTEQNEIHLDLIELNCIERAFIALNGTRLLQNKSTCIEWNLVHLNMVRNQIVYNDEKIHFELKIEKSSIGLKGILFNGMAETQLGRKKFHPLTWNSIGV